MASATDYYVSSITVTGSFKQWTDPTRDEQGVSGGSEISLTVVPDHEKIGWLPSEAEVIGIELRMKIHVMLMADAQLRGVTIPATASHALSNYKQRVQTLKDGLNGEVTYRDEEVPSPAPSMVEDTHLDTSEVFSDQGTQ
jgi:hypothetical protein